MKPHRGTLILVLGILSLIVCGFLGIPAWIMGNNDLKEIEPERWIQVAAPSPMRGEFAA